jgi:alkylation response protein AidB-like acyl-CoA dehydrogenase
MHFGWSPEQLAMKEAAAGFLAASPGPRAMEARWPEGLWARIVEEQGWPAVAVPEALGGWGFGVLDLAVVFEELGRRLTPCPMLSTVALALPVLVAAGAADAVAGLLAGEKATLARGSIGLQPVDGGWKVQGTLTGVPDGALADWVVVVDQGRVLVVRPDATNARASLDTTRPLADVVLDQVVPEERCFSDVNTDAAWRQSLVLLAAEQVGVAEAAMDLAVEYAKVEREHEADEPQESPPSPVRNHQRGLGGDRQDVGHALKLAQTQGSQAHPADAGLPALPRLGLLPFAFP